MKNNSRFYLAVVSCISFLSISAHALSPATQGEAYVESITLQQSSDDVVVTLQNTSNSPFASQVNVQPVSDMMHLSLSATVKCIKDKKVNFDHGRAYFGHAISTGGSVDDVNALASSNYTPSFTEWDGIGNGQWNTEAGNQETFNVSLAALKDGPANLAFDPVAELNKRLQTHVQKGGKAIDFLRADHTFSVTRSISVAGWCRKDGMSSNKVGAALMNLKVKYVGDKKLTDTAQINAQLGNVPNQINQDLPMKLVQATFQPNMPHYVGSCAPAQDPLIRVNYSGSGKGTVRFSIEDGAAVYGTQDIAFDAAQGPAYFDFKYPLQAKFSGNPDWLELNKTFNHNLKVRAKYRDYRSNTWSDWQDYGSSLWKHRCTPSVNPALGGNGNIQFAPTQPSNSGLTIQAKPSLLKPLGIKPPQDNTPKPLGFAVPTAPVPRPNGPAAAADRVEQPTPEFPPDDKIQVPVRPAVKLKILN